MKTTRTRRAWEEYLNWTPKHLVLSLKMQFFESKVNASFPTDAYNFSPTDDTASTLTPTSLSIPDPASLLSEFNLIFNTFFSETDCEHRSTDSAPSFYQHDNSPPPQGSSMDDITLPPATPGHSNNSSQRQRSVIPATSPVRKTRTRNGKCLGVEQRKQKLQNDEYVLSFESTKVTCAGCRKEITLDSRNGAQYYLRAFRNHKKVCRGVRDGMVSCSVFCSIIDLLNLTVLLKDRCKTQRRRKNAFRLNCFNSCDNDVFDYVPL